jgi:putative membrane protein (TIGR04086 family)
MFGRVAMKRRTIFKSRGVTLITAPLASAIIAFAVILTVISAFSFLISKIDVSNLMLSAMSTAALCIGAYTGGYISGKRRRRNGLLMGTLCGVFIFLIIVILSRIFSKAAESFSMPVKLVLTLICAAVGGVVGVNSKGGRY